MKFWACTLIPSGIVQIKFDFLPPAPCTFGSILSFTVGKSGFQRVYWIRLSVELPPFHFYCFRFFFPLVYGFIIKEDCTSVNTISDFSFYFCLFSVLYNNIVIF